MLANRLTATLISQLLYTCCVRLKIKKRTAPISFTLRFITVKEIMLWQLIVHTGKRNMTQLSNTSFLWDVKLYRYPFFLLASLISCFFVSFCFCWNVHQRPLTPKLADFTPQFPLNAYSPFPPRAERGLPLPRLILRTCDTYSLFRLLLLGFGYCLRVSWLFWFLCLTSSVSLSGPLHSSKESQRKKTLFV